MKSTDSIVVCDKTGRKRCWWCINDPLYVEYHDSEWGVPLHDDRRLFEMLILEGFQAGLSWLTILRKRSNFRKAFSNFDPRRVAAYGSVEKRRLMRDAGIVRNRLKIDAAITNARSFLAVQQEFGSFDSYIWGFTGHKVLRSEKSINRRNIPARTELSDMISKDLKKRGFKFVGSTIIYAHMQATGMVNDHVDGCFRSKRPRRLEK